MSHSDRYDGLPSVTEIIGATNPSPYEGIPIEILEAKGKIGTQVHDYAHEIITAGPQKSGNDAARLFKESLSEGALGYARAFDKFYDLIQVIAGKVLLCEQPLTMYEETRGGVMEYGGTPDLLIQHSITRDIILMDFKTRKPILPHDQLQLGGYSKLVLHNLGVSPDECWIIELRPNGNYKLHSVIANNYGFKVSMMDYHKENRNEGSQEGSA